MVQYYTLEQAAQLLQMTPDQLREMVRQNKIRAFQDRGTLRFRAQEIDELARVQGLGSDPGLPLGDGSKPPSSVRRRTQQAAPPSTEESTDDQQAVPLGESPSGRSKGTPSSSAKRRTPPGKSSKVNPAAKASDSDVRLVPDGSSMDFELSLDDNPPAAKSPPPKPRKSGLIPDSQKSDSDIRMEAAPSPGSDSDVKIVPDDSDTDNEAVHLGQSRAKTPSDSDIRMELDEPLPGTGHPNRPRSDPLVTEEIDLDLEALEQDAAAKSKPPSSKRTKTPQTKSPSQPKLPASSPFELSDSDLPAPATPPTRSKSGKALQDSSSDFELTLDDSSPVGDSSPLGDSSPTGDSSLPLNLDDEEVSLGELSAASGQSGINLDAPADSGISLEADGSDELEFELSLDDGSPSAVKSRSGGGKKSGPPAESSEFELSLDPGEGPPADSDSEFELSLDDSGSSELALEGSDAESESGSDSEFELTLDEEGGLSPVEEESSDLAVEEDEGNLFEETDFDVPALDDESGSEAVALDDESSSDFDLAVDDSVELEASASGSQVVTVDEGEESGEADETQARSARRGRAAAEEEGEEGLDLDLEGSDEAEMPEEEVEEEEGAVRPRGPVQYAEAPPAEWGVMPALVMLPCVIVLFFVGLIGFELAQGMWGYHKGTKVTGMLIHPLAKSLIDDKLPEE